MTKPSVTQKATACARGGTVDITANGFDPGVRIECTVQLVNTDGTLTTLSISYGTDGADGVTSLHLNPAHADAKLRVTGAEVQVCTDGIDTPVSTERSATNQFAESSDRECGALRGIDHMGAKFDVEIGPEPARRDLGRAAGHVVGEVRGDRRGGDAHYRPGLGRHRRLTEFSAASAQVWQYSELHSRVGLGRCRGRIQLGGPGTRAASSPSSPHHEAISRGVNLSFGQPLRRTARSS